MRTAFDRVNVDDMMAGLGRYEALLQELEDLRGQPGQKSKAHRLELIISMHHLLIKGAMMRRGLYAFERIKDVEAQWYEARSALALCNAGSKTESKAKFLKEAEEHKVRAQACRHEAERYVQMRAHMPFTAPANDNDDNDEMLIDSDPMDPHDDSDIDHHRYQVDLLRSLANSTPCTMSSRMYNDRADWHQMLVDYQERPPDEGELRAYFPADVNAWVCLGMPWRDHCVYGTIAKIRRAEGDEPRYRRAKALEQAFKAYYACASSMSRDGSVRHWGYTAAYHHARLVIKHGGDVQAAHKDPEYASVHTAKARARELEDQYVVEELVFRAFAPLYGLDEVGRDAHYVDEFGVQHDIWVIDCIKDALCKGLDLFRYDAKLNRVPC